MSAAHAYEPAYANRVERMKASEIRELLKLRNCPGSVPSLSYAQAGGQFGGGAG